MALTQSARLPGPSWDEEVVPALRKRLESESRTLARRMSARSISSLEEQESNHVPMVNDNSYREGTAGGYSISAHSQQNTSAYPRSRVDLQQPRTSSDRSNTSSRANGIANANGASVKSTGARARTYSQPFPSDSPNNRVNGAGNAKGNENRSKDSVAASRSTSPRQQELKPTRIPKSTRSRTGSTSTPHATHGLTINGYTQSPYPPQTPQTPHGEFTQSQDLWVVRETAPTNSSQSIVSRHQPGLLNEAPPFHPGSATSSNMYSSNENFNNSSNDYYDSPPRPSVESEEHPYEHWYRGEVSRNGGVGELRVGKRTEMLEIANYGHRLDAKPPTTRNAVTEAIDEHRRRRKRADSVGGRERGSFYLDDDGAARVLDESPLTDLEGEEASDLGHASDYYQNMVLESSTASAPPPSSSSSHDLRSTTPTPANMRAGAPPSRIPTAGPPRTTTPTPTASMNRGASEPPSFPSTRPSISQQQRSASGSSATPTKQKRAVSPAANSASKKARTAASKATRAKTEAARREAEQGANRRSVAHYPTPEDGMEDAIPTWTQPVPRQGNWDDVVLPVVARKKGLDAHYEQADGSPRAKKEGPVEPAPGTFGYDHSKYRAPGDDFRSIPMDEFGRPGEQIAEEDDEELKPHRPPAISTNSHESQLRRGGSALAPPPSPAPFAHYAPSAEGKLQPVSGNPMKLEMDPVNSEGEHGGGCCKCVVM